MAVTPLPPQESRDFPHALLHLLDRWGRINLRDIDKVLADSARSGQELEAYLVFRAGVPRGELLRAIIELKGSYGIPLGSDWVESNLHHVVDEKQARNLRLLPLALYKDRLYCLLEQRKDARPAAEPERLLDKVELIALGVVDNLTPQLDALYETLRRTDAEHASLGEFLVAQKLVRREDVKRALAVQRRHGGRIGQILLRDKVLTEPAFYEALAAFRNIPFYGTGRLLELAEPAIARRVPQAYAEANTVIGLKIEDDAAWLATSHPENIEVLDAVAKALGCSRCHAGVAAPSSINSVMQVLYEAEPGRHTLTVGATPDRFDAAIEGREMPEVPKYVNLLLLDAVRRRASDIHIEWHKDRVEVKYRIDGTLVRIDDSPINQQNVPWVVAKIKVEARMDIAERRRPQDGAIRARYGEQAVDFRVAVQPTIWGENVVIRVLNQAVGVPSLDDLGFASHHLARLRRIIQNPQGFVLLTGPTGCGKTTTLYAILRELHSTDTKIVTAEDPVEYAVDGIQQSQVNESIGNTFDCYLRAFMRQDPDIILVGEVRDSETAEMAVRAALTGHLIFSTLHVNDAIGSVRRLVDLGVDPNLVAQTLLGVVSQRLARRCCPRCSEPDRPSAELQIEFFPLGVPANAKFMKGRGCLYCRNTGYQGRLALIEYWEPDDQARRLIDRRAEAPELRDNAVHSGMRPLVRDALEKAMSGLTTLEELRSVLPYEQIRRHCSAPERATDEPLPLARGALVPAVVARPPAKARRIPQRR